MILPRIVAALLIGACLVAAAEARPPASAFARLPHIEHVSISPNGERIAYVTNDEDRKLIAVIEVGGGLLNAVNASHLRVQDTFWHDEDTLLLRVGDVRGLFAVRGDVDYSALFTLDVNTGESRQLVTRGRNIGFNPNASRVAGVERSTGRLLMPLRDDDRRLNLVAVDPDTGGRHILSRGGESTRYWIADATGERHVEFRYLDSAGRYRIILHDGDVRRELARTDAPLIDLFVHGFTTDGAAIAVRTFDREGGGTQKLQRVELRDGQVSATMFQDPVYDFRNARIDPHSGAVIGVTIEREQAETVWFDPELARFQDLLETAFQNAAVHIRDWSRDRARFIVSTKPADAPPSYFLFDRATMNAAPILSAYPELAQTRLAPRRPVRLTMRDGLVIDAYLTAPAGRGPHPFVVLPHGGPSARDTSGFDDFAHFLASRGYGVIQPNFRGSDGYGAAFETAGYGEWGRGTMQHDVTDATQWLITEGLADPARICIAGLSYGGYAALAGAAFTPELYACSISINGVTDLRRFIDYVDDRYGEDSQPARYWRLAMTGELNPDRLSRVLREISPIEHAGAIRIPVLLMHGEDDTVVPRSQSRDMHRALRRAGAEVRYVGLDGGDHWLLEYPTRLAVFQEMERFLAEHIGP